MPKFAPIAIATAVMLTAASAASAPTPIVPAAFLGEWNAPLSACGTDGGDARLRISGDRIRFAESTGTITAVVRHGPRAIDVTARYSGEGERWSRTDSFTLSASGQDLIAGTGNERIVRHRCPRRSH